MMRVFLEALPFALGGAISPTVLAIEMLILAAPDRGRLKGLLYFFGTLAFSILFVVALHFVLRGVGLARPNKTKDQIDGIVDLVIGSLLVIWAVVRILRGTPPPKTKDAERARKPMGLGAAFGVGFAMMAFNFSTLPLYALAVRTIDRSKLVAAEELALVAAVTIIVLIPSWLPVTLAYVAPTHAQSVLDGLRSFLELHGRMIITVMLALFGFYLVVKGGPKLWPSL